MAFDTATQTVEARNSPAVQALCGLLAEQELPVADVLGHKDLKGEGQTAIAKAWATGLIEFGRVKHVVCGRPAEGDNPAVADTSVKESERPTALLIEDGIEWGGARQTYHARFRDLWERAKQLPLVEKFRKYIKVKDEATGEMKSRIVEIKKDEAEKLMTLHVRLTDRGLGW